MHRNQIIANLTMTLPVVDPSFRGDANETLAFARQLEHFFAKQYEIEYPESMGRKIIPVDTSVPTGAASHTYRMFDDQGEAVIIDHYGQDLPSVESTGKEYAQKIVGLGQSFSISIQDLRAAAMTGVDIDGRKARTARTAMERKLDAMMCVGDTKIGFTGFANHGSLPACAPTTGNWLNAGTTAAQIQADVEKICVQIFNSTKGIHANPDNGSQLTLALPPELWAKLASTRVDTFNMTTILEYIKSTIPMVKDIVSWSRLSTAGAANGRRIVAFHKSDDVLTAVIPQEFEMLPLQPKSLGWTVPCHMRFGGVVWRYPLAGAYMDGC